MGTAGRKPPGPSRGGWEGPALGTRWPASWRPQCRLCTHHSFLIARELLAFLFPHSVPQLVGASACPPPGQPHTELVGPSLTAGASGLGAAWAGSLGAACLSGGGTWERGPAVCAAVVDAPLTAPTRPLPVCQTALLHPFLLPYPSDAPFSGLGFLNIPCHEGLALCCLSSACPAMSWLPAPPRHPSPVPVHAEPALSALLSTGSSWTPRAAWGGRAAWPPGDHAHAAGKCPQLWGWVGSGLQSRRGVGPWPCLRGGLPPGHSLAPVWASRVIEVGSPGCPTHTHVDTGGRGPHLSAGIQGWSPRSGWSKAVWLLAPESSATVTSWTSKWACPPPRFLLEPDLP